MLFYVFTVALVSHQGVRSYAIERHALLRYLTKVVGHLIQSSWSLCGLLMIFMAHSVAAEQPSTDSILQDKEYEVWAAVVEQVHLPKAPRWFMVCDSTVTLECSSAKSTGFKIGDCSGMRTISETEEQRLQWVKSNIPEIIDDVVIDLQNKSRSIAKITKKLPLGVKQVVWGPTSNIQFPKDSGDPDFAVYPSRVGFDKSQTHALVYMGVASWIDISHSFGEYVYLLRENSKWLVKNRARVWSMGSEQ
ncbi:MAG: hypothetical protein HY761_10595 [Candidatus Omnitrophica bacterium]|nr:hypothetical protein [Candidatus Omnitrophota bacterium]